MRLPSIPLCDDAEFDAGGTPVREKGARLWLTRKVAESGPVGLIIGLNPSKAGADRRETDHTITKEIEFSRRWGWSGFIKANLFTCIETYSGKLKGIDYRSAVGGFGDRVLEELIPMGQEIVVCWGAAVPKQHRRRITEVCAKIQYFKQEQARVLCFGLSQDGDPLHPLRLSYDTPLMPYFIKARPWRRDP